MDWKEIIGFITGVLCVALLIRQSIWNWPIALINAIFYAIVFFEARLYADVGLQVFFFAINCYGWYEWRHGGPSGTLLSVTRMNGKEIGLSLTAILCGTIAIGTLLAKTTDAAMPYWDSLATSMSLTAQFLMARKKLENWIIWIAVNILYVGIYFYRGLYLTQILYVIFLVLAILAYREWRRSMTAQTA